MRCVFYVASFKPNDNSTLPTPSPDGEEACLHCSVMQAIQIESLNETLSTEFSLGPFKAKCRSKSGTACCWQFAARTGQAMAETTRPPPLELNFDYDLGGVRVKYLART
jgi:hypothetical protein